MQPESEPTHTSFDSPEYDTPDKEKYGTPDNENPEWTAEDFRTAMRYPNLPPETDAHYRGR